MEAEVRADNVLVYWYQRAPSPWGIKLWMLPMTAVKQVDDKKPHEGAAYEVRFEGRYHPALILEVRKDSFLSKLAGKIFLEEYRLEKEERGQTLAESLGLTGPDVIIPPESPVKVELLDFDEVIDTQHKQSKNDDNSTVVPEVTVNGTPLPEQQALADSSVLLAHPVPAEDPVPSAVSVVPPADMDTRAFNWLTQVQPVQSPYFPQTDDLLYYFPEAHHAYNVIAQGDHSGADESVKQNRPWTDAGLRLNMVTIVKVLRVDFAVKNPSGCKVATVTVEILSDNGPKVAFEICLQAFPDAEDFLILQQLVDRSRVSHFASGQRVRSVVLDVPTQELVWINGEILDIVKSDSDFPEDCYHSLGIRWDGNPADLKQLSPWDVSLLEVASDDEPADRTAVTPSELGDLSYKSPPADWCFVRTSTFRQLLDKVVENKLAKSFRDPVDRIGIAGAHFHRHVARPVDLTMIRKRLVSGFYRRISALQQDIEQICVNTAAVWGQNHATAKTAYIVVDVCLQVIKDGSVREDLGKIFAKHTELWNGKWKSRCPSPAPASSAEVSSSSCPGNNDHMKPYDVEKILDIRQVNGETEYKVKWKNWSAAFATWEPSNHLIDCARVVAEFERRNKAREKASAARKSTVTSGPVADNPTDQSTNDPQPLFLVLPKNSPRAATGCRRRPKSSVTGIRKRKRNPPRAAATPTKRVARGSRETLARQAKADVGVLSELADSDSDHNQDEEAVEEPPSTSFPVDGQKVSRAGRVLKPAFRMFTTY